MRIAPIDIYKREFKKVIRGVDPDEVEEFLQQVADDYEQIIKETADQKSRIEFLEVQLAKGDKTEQPDASKTASEIIQKAREEENAIIQEAKNMADKIVQNADMKANNMIREARDTAIKAEAVSADIGEYTKIDSISDSVIEEAKAKASEIIEKAKMEEMEQRREISRLKSQKERFLIGYRTLLDKHLKLLTDENED